MEKKIKKLYLADYITIYIFLALFWILLITVTLNVLSLRNDSSIKVGIIFAVILIGIFGTASSIAVIVHLKTNKLQIYSEEISTYQKDDMNKTK